jgi:YegS/Rv2252/BmrU family lipid kinase
MRRAALIYNPIAGRGRWERVLEAVLRTCRREGFELEPVPTAAPGQATDLAADLAREGRVEAVFALGGDGTAREVAAGLLGSRTALGILPGGTANLMALALGLPRDPADAAAVLCHAPARSFDAGLAGASAFLMMISAGLDGRALAALDRGLKTRLGKTAVALQGVREWWRYGYPEIEIVADGEQLPPATFLAVCNIPYYGGSYRMAPGARPDDRRFELVTFHGSGRAATLAFILGVMSGRHTRRADVSVRAVEEVVFSVPPEAGLQVDGDPIPRAGSGGSAGSGGPAGSAGSEGRRADPSAEAASADLAGRPEQAHPGEGATIVVRLAPDPLLVLAPAVPAAHPAHAAHPEGRT